MILIQMVPPDCSREKLYEAGGIPSTINFTSNGNPGVRLSEFEERHPYKVPSLDNRDDLIIETHQSKITYKLLVSSNYQFSTV